MKVTVVPAQVTTVEDRIIGNLSMPQLMLLLVPVFVGFGVFSFLPPFMEGSIYKYVVLSLMALVCSVLSIRVKGRILMQWLVTLLRYYSRPGVYVYDKNSGYLRVPSEGRTSSQDTSESLSFTKVSELKSLSLAAVEMEVRDEAAAFESINQPNSPVRFEVDSKGGLYVRIRETEA